MAGLSVFFLYNLTARAQDIGILSISNPSKEVIALKHFSLPHGLVPLLALALVVSMATPASAFFWQKKENTPAGVADFSKNTLAGGSVTFSQEDFRSSDLSSITLTALPDPKAGVLTVGGQPLTQGAVVDASALSGLTFQSLPTPGVSTASFTFLPAFADGTSAGKETTVTLYLLDEANDPPIARNMELSTYQNIAVTGYFDAVDGEGDTLTFQLTSTPARGAVELAEDGSARFVYTPYENKTGKDSFTYVALDQAGNTSPEAKVTLCIEKPNTKVTYADLEGSAAHKAAIRLAEEGILVGESHGGRYFFQPEQTVSRAEFLALAMDAAGLEPMEDVTVTGFSHLGQGERLLRPESRSHPGGAGPHWRPRVLCRNGHHLRRGHRDAGPPAEHGRRPSGGRRALRPGALGRSGGRQSGRLWSAHPGPVHLRRPVRAPDPGCRRGAAGRGPGRAGRPGGAQLAALVRPSPSQ